MSSQSRALHPACRLPNNSWSKPRSSVTPHWPAAFKHSF